MQVGFNRLAMPLPKARFGNHTPSPLVNQVASKVEAGLISAGFRADSFYLEKTRRTEKGHTFELIDVLYDQNKPGDYQNVVNTLAALPGSVPTPNGQTTIDGILVKVALFHPDLFPNKPPVIIQ